MSLSDYIKEVSVITHFYDGDSYNDILKITKKNVVYKKYNSLGDEVLLWSTLKVSENLVEDLFNSLRYFPEKEMKFNGNERFEILIKYNDNSIEKVKRFGSFIENGFYDYAKKFIRLIPEGYDFSPAVKVPLIKVNNVIVLNEENLKTINPLHVRVLFSDARNGYLEIFVEEKHDNYNKYIIGFSNDSKLTGDKIMKYIFKDYEKSKFWDKFKGNINYSIADLKEDGLWHSMYLGCDIFIHMNHEFMNEYGYDILSNNCNDAMKKWVNVAGKRE